MWYALQERVTQNTAERHKFDVIIVYVEGTERRRVWDFGVRAGRARGIMVSF